MMKISILFLLMISFPNNAQPLLVWKFNTALPVYSSPIVSGNIVYFGSNDSTLYALSADDGTIKWKFRTGGEIRSNVCIHDNSLFLNGGDGIIYSLDKNSGKLLWDFKSEGEKIYPLYSYADYFHSSPVFNNNIVYFASGAGCLSALNASDGKEIWRFQTNDVIHSTPVLYNNKIYVGSFDGFIYCLDAAKGTMSWKFKTVGQRYFPKGEVQGHLTADCGLIFAGARDYNLYAIDAEEGYCHWNRQFPKGWSLALTAVDSVLFAGTSDDDIMFAFDCLTGKELWSRDVNFNIFGPPLPLDSSLYFGSLKGIFYKLNAADGKIIWSFNSDGYE